MGALSRDGCSPRLPVALCIVVFGGLACQFSDIVAFSNSTQDPLLLNARVDGEFARYDCDGGGADLIRFSDETDVEIPPGRRICLEGPAISREETYDVRDRLVSVAISRAGLVCVEGDGASLFDQFTVNRSYKTITVDDTDCPGLPATSGDAVGDEGATEPE